MCILTKSIHPSITRYTMKRTILLTLAIILAVSSLAEAQRGLDTLQLKTIFADPYLAGNRPQTAGFNPNNKTVYFNWNDSSYARNKFFQVDFDGKNLKEASNDDRMFGNPNLSPDKKLMLLTQRGNLVLANADGSNQRILVSTPGADINGVWSADGQKVAYRSGGNVWVVNIKDTEVRQITNFTETNTMFQIRTWAKNDSLVVIATADNSDSREVFFPTYVGKFVTPGGSPRGVNTMIVQTVDVYSRKMETLLTGKISLRGLSSNQDGRYLVVDQSDEFLKNREIGVYDFKNGNAYTPVFTDVTEGWITSSFNDARFVEDTNLISFTSEQTGWNHIYTVNPDGSALKQHTFGNWQIDWYQWLDKNRIIYASTEVDPGERHLYVYDVNRGRTQKITDTAGYRNQFRLSPDRKTVVFAKSWFNEPDDLYALNVDRPRGEVRLTQSIPDRFKAIDFQMPEYIQFTGRDGETSLQMELIKPYNFDPSKKYPVVVFVHGAGSLQNVYKGWSSNYWREYLFHHYLAMRGYVVIEVDYRHSLGYGRKFREDVTNWMGKYELEDIIDGIDYVAKDGYLDVDKVGVYGGSYGGFMALYALHLAPDRFHVGAALRAVTNWENYYYANPWYTGPRLGHPDTHRENYDRSSPLTFADSLSRPALILHGVIDDNVGFQDAMQYVERLIQSGNEEFDLMVYPSERHSFVSPAAWYDEYRRIFDYFEKYLK